MNLSNFKHEICEDEEWYGDEFDVLIHLYASAELDSMEGLDLGTDVQYEGHYIGPVLNEELHQELMEAFPHEHIQAHLDRVYNEHVEECREWEEEEIPLDEFWRYAHFGVYEYEGQLMVQFHAQLGLA